jgi:hypothetical protein
VLPDDVRESNLLCLPKVAEIISQLGEELAFVAPNRDAGLLPLNRFVMDLEELTEHVPLVVAAGLKVARRLQAARVRGRSATCILLAATGRTFGQRVPLFDLHQRKEARLGSQVHRQVFAPIAKRKER